MSCPTCQSLFTAIEKDPRPVNGVKTVTYRCRGCGRSFSVEVKVA